jgi:hypothetical protein
LRTSWNGSIEDGWAIFVTGSRFIAGVGAFLNVGSFGFGLGAEKNEESDLASFTEVTTAFGSFFTIEDFDRTGGATAIFFGGGADFMGCDSFSFRFLLLVSIKS